jgi:hypothetical protein
MDRRMLTLSIGTTLAAYAGSLAAFFWRAR